MTHIMASTITTAPNSMYKIAVLWSKKASNTNTATSSSENIVIEFGHS